jgi:hypothetical protein
VCQFHFGCFENILFLPDIETRIFGHPEPSHLPFGLSYPRGQTITTEFKHRVKKNALFNLLKVNLCMSQKLYILLKHGLRVTDPDD